MDVAAAPAPDCLRPPLAAPIPLRPRLDHQRCRVASPARHRDLVDLVPIVTEVSVDAAPQKTAPKSEAERRRLRLPKRFDVPARDLWEPGYARQARESHLSLAPTLDDALRIVRPFLDPLL